MNKYFSVIIGLILLSACASVQEISKQGTSISPGQIAIINETDTSHFLYIGAESSAMNRIDIEPGDTWISPSFNGRPHVRLYYSEERFEEYLLMPGLFYHLYFDYRKKRTDIKLLRNR
jgi:uncharacterized protein YcfL